MISNRPLRLGFAVKILGKPGLKSNDSRRWQNKPHLRVSLEYLEKIFDYLQEHRIEMYRMSSDLAPYATHPKMPQFHNMVKECRGELRELGRTARDRNFRLSFHPSQYIVLNSPDRELTQRSVRDLVVQAEILDEMGLGPEAVLVIHVGGAYGDRAAGNQRWVQTWKKLPAAVRQRLVLEHDDLRFSAADILWIHNETGVRLIFDYQHFWCFNPEQLPLLPTLHRILATWPEGVRPKIHFSSPHTEMREIKRKKETAYIAPIWQRHADFVNPFEFCTFLRSASGLKFDVMLESKSKDLSLIRLRADLLRYAPDVAARFGFTQQRFFQQEEEEAFEKESAAR